MMSKNLFFKLMKEDFKRRLWAAALIGLACFFLFPVMAALMAGNIEDYSSYARGLQAYTRDMINIMSFHNEGMIFGMVIASLICGLSSFSYLNSRSKVDFYHGIPVRREKLYAANYLNGILILAVPYGISVVLAVIVGVSNGISNHVLTPAALSAYGLNLVYYILMYSTVVIAAMLTGNTVVGFLGSMVFAVIVPLAVSLVQGCYEVFFETYCLYVETPFYEYGVRISPLIEYITQVETYESKASMLPSAAAALIISALLALLGCFLYRKRPSEAAGKAMAFPISCPINRIALTLVSAIGLGTFFWEMRNSTGWVVFGVICGAVICHCVVEIIYHFDFRKLFSHKLQLIGCILVSLAVLLVFRYDLFGYDTYLPKAEQVESAAIDIRLFDDWVSYGSLFQESGGEYDLDWQDSSRYILRDMKYEDVENLLAIAREGIRQLKRGQQDQPVYEVEYTAAEGLPLETMQEEREADWTTVVICYTLKSGRRVYREYNLSVDDILPQMDRLMADTAFQKSVYPVMKREQDQVAAIRYREGEEEIVLEDLAMDKKNALLAAYQRDLGTMTIERMYEEAPVGLIRFTSGSEEAAMKWAKEQEKLAAGDSYAEYHYSGHWAYGWLANRDYYPVYPSFTETLALLGEQDVRAGEYFRNLNVQTITIHKYTEEDNQNVVIIDPEEIGELMKVLRDSDRMYYNPFFRSEKRLDATLSYVWEGENYDRNVLFPRGKVPQLVWDHLKKEE